MPLGSCRPTGHGTLSDVGIFSLGLSGVEPDIQVQGKFTLFGGARLFFLGGSSVKCAHRAACVSSRAAMATTVAGRTNLRNLGI